MARYTMGGSSTASSSTPMSFEQFLAMQEDTRSKRGQKRMQWLTIGIGAFDDMNATAQHPIEDKRSVIDAPAIDTKASDIEDMDFAAVVDIPSARAALGDLAVEVGKLGHLTATANQRGIDNNGKQGLLGGGSNNNNNLLLLLAFGLLVADDD